MQALPERRFLLWHYLQGDGLPDRFLPRALRDPADGRMAGTLERVPRRRGEQDRPAAPEVPRRRRQVVQQPGWPREKRHQLRVESVRRVETTLFRFVGSIKFL